MLKMDIWCRLHCSGKSPKFLTSSKAIFIEPMTPDRLFTLKANWSARASKEGHETVMKAPDDDSILIYFCYGPTLQKRFFPSRKPDLILSCQAFIASKSTNLFVWLISFGIHEIISANERNTALLWDK